MNEELEPRGDRGVGSILRATSILGSSSLITIAIGLVTSKAWAVLIGPNGLGYLSLVQNLLSLAGLIFGLGIGTGVVRNGANALEQGDDERLALTLRASWLLTVALGVLGLAVLALFAEPLSVAMLGGPHHRGTVILVGVALLLSLVSGLQMSIVNAYHRVSVLARAAIATSIASATVNLAIIWHWRQAGIPAATVATAVVGVTLSTFFWRRSVPRVAVPVGWRASIRHVRILVRFGGPFTASMLVGAGAQMILPTLALHMLGTTDVGLYKAATAVAGTYLGFLLVAMGQDYYPRVSAVRDRTVELRELVNQQNRLVLLLSIPIILGALALVPYLLVLVYSPRFSPASDVLEWMLIGDIFKFSSWTMAFVILARSGSTLYFLTELVSGTTTLAASWFGMRWFGLTGLGVGYLTGYAAYFIIVFVVVRREIALRWTTHNVWLLVGSLGAVAIVRTLPITGLSAVRTPVALALALLAAGYCLRVLLNDVGGVRALRRFAW